MYSGRKQRAVALKVDVAATDEHADSFAMQFGFHFRSGRKTKTAGGFHYQLHAFRKKSHGVDQFLVGYGENIRDVALNLRPRIASLDEATRGECPMLKGSD
jgi:hypothetical protein